MAVNGADVAARAQNYIGLKYVWGGVSLTSGADCSGFLLSLYAQFGIKVPRVTYDQINSGSKVSYDNLQAGDMVFFDTDASKSGPDHVGMYIGGGKFIHAPRPGDSVKISNMNDGYYSTRYIAARRPDGMVGGGFDAPGADDSGPTRPRLSPEELAAEYGWAYGFLTSQPELAKVFEQAVAETWESARFQAALKNTDWWKKTSEAARLAQVERATDPATYNAKLNATSFKVREMAAQIGAILPDGMINRIAESVYNSGIGDAELKDILGSYIEFTAEGTLAGQAGMAEMKLKQLAFANGVQLSPDTIKNYAQMIAMNMSTMEQAEQEVRNMAKSMFPNFAEQIDSGMNMADIAMPYMQMATQELEITPSEATLMNPIVKQGLNGLTQKGEPHGMSLTDYQNYLRSDPRWFKTSKAQDTLMQVGNDVLRQMGLVS